MALRLHLLCDGMASLNGQAFCFPILQRDQALRREGIHVSLYRYPEKSFYSGDLLAVDRKYCSYVAGWREEDARHFFSSLRKFNKPLIFFDDSDSSGKIWNSVLESTDLYVKNQILSDPKRYLQTFYDGVDYADYYYRNYAENLCRREAKRQVRDEKQLRKLAVGWNSGLSDHAREGRKRLRRARFFLRHVDQRVASRLLTCPTALAEPDAARPISLHTRMKLEYDPASFSIQRVLISEKLGHQFGISKLGRKRYFQELRKTWAVLSPFGYGEITLKDFESFLCGNVLIKPNVDHISTWPMLYEKWKTYVPIAWDLSDLEETLYDIEHNREKYLPIALEGQRRYVHYLADLQSGQLFTTHFTGILSQVI